MISLTSVEQNAEELRITYTETSKYSSCDACHASISRVFISILLLFAVLYVVFVLFRGTDISTQVS